MSCADANGDRAGLAFRLRAWEAPQINALQAQLKELNLPKTVQTAMRTQRAAMCQTVLSDTREELDETLRANERNAPLWNQIRKPMLFLIHFAPRGVLLQNLANLAEAEQSEITQYDARKGLIFPWPPSTNSEPSGPYNILIGHYLGGTGTAAWKAAARNQTLVNQAQVALALERYHHLHHQYPEQLTALQPDFLDVIPRDLIGGQPMQYSQTNGEFNLTSASWPKATPTGTWEWLAPNQ